MPLFSVSFYHVLPPTGGQVGGKPWKKETESELIIFINRKKINPRRGGISSHAKDGGCRKRDRGNWETQVGRRSAGPRRVWPRPGVFKSRAMFTGAKNLCKLCLLHTHKMKGKRRRAGGVALFPIVLETSAHFWF